MKFQAYCVAVIVAAGSVAADIFPARSGARPLDSRGLSLKGRNIFGRQTYDFCGSTSYYCETSGGCCGITSFSCLPAGAECCSSLSQYGYDLWCPSGSSCIIESGYVQCEDSSGNFVSADTTAFEAPTSTAEEPSPTDTGGGGSGSSSNNKPGGSSTKTGGKKKISGAIIGGAVAGPLLGAIVIGAVVFFLCIKKKKKTQANANAAIIASQNGGGGQGGQPAMTSVPPPTPMGGGSNSYFPTQNQDMKTPAYTQQYEVPTPIASPPPQWTPASPSPNNISPAPVSPPQQVAQPYNGGMTTPVSPVHTGNGAAYVQPMYQPPPAHGNAVELPLHQQHTPQFLPRRGAHEMQ